MSFVLCILFLKFSIRLRLQVLKISPLNFLWIFWLLKTAVVVLSTHTSIKCYFYIFRSFGTVGFNTFYLGTELRSARAWWHEGCRIWHYLSWTDSNRVCCFQTLDAVFPKDLFSDYLLTYKYSQAKPGVRLWESPIMCKQTMVFSHMLQVKW